MKRFGVSRQSVALTAVSAVCVALLLPHGASSAVSRQSGDIQLVGKTKYLNNAHSAVTHTVDDSTKHVVAVIDADFCQELQPPARPHFGADGKAQVA